MGLNPHIPLPGVKRGWGLVPRQVSVLTVAAAWESRRGWGTGGSRAAQGLHHRTHPVGDPPRAGRDFPPVSDFIRKDPGLS